MEWEGEEEEEEEEEEVFSYYSTIKPGIYYLHAGLSIWGLSICK